MWGTEKHNLRDIIARSYDEPQGLTKDYKYAKHLFNDRRVRSRALEIMADDNVLEDHVLNGDWRYHTGIGRIYYETLYNYPNDRLLVSEVFHYLDSLSVENAAASLSDSGLILSDQVAYILQDSDKMGRLLMLLYLMEDRDVVVLTLLQAIKSGVLTREEAIDYATNYPSRFIREEIAKGDIIRKVNGVDKWYMVIGDKSENTTDNEYLFELIQSVENGRNGPPMGSVLGYLVDSGNLGERIFTRAFMSRERLRELIQSYKKSGVSADLLLNLFLGDSYVIDYAPTITSIVTTIVSVYGLTYEYLWDNDEWREGLDYYLSEEV